MIYKITGIYDEETLVTPKKLGIRHFGFDFRPTSFNFIQQHLFNCLAEDQVGDDDQVYLHFSNEKYFVIDKIYNEAPLKKGPGGQVLLEFSDGLGVDFYRQFENPFIWHYLPDHDIDALLSHPLMKGLVLDISFLKGLLERRQLESFALEFSELSRKLRPQGIDLYLNCKWDSNIFPSFLEYFSFSFITLPIDPSVERSYRHFDLGRFTDCFTKLTSYGR